MSMAVLVKIVLLCSAVFQLKKENAGSLKMGCYTSVVQEH